MRTVVQRVRQANVSIAGQGYSAIGNGMLVLVGISGEDGEDDIDWLIRKLLNLRIFEDARGVMNCSLLESGGSLLLVSQFTLYGDTRKGNRPSYIQAAPPAQALPVYQRLCEKLSELLGDRFASGAFGADMQVALINDGPVTLLLESPGEKRTSVRSSGRGPKPERG